jgi:hypothetical protein
MKKLSIFLIVILSGCTDRPEIGGAVCAEKCKLMKAYEFKVNPNDPAHCECYVRLKDDED